MVIDIDAVREETRRWLESVVVGLNLCPFARRPLDQGQVRIAVCEAEDFESLLTYLYAEMSLLWDKPPEKVETTLIVCPTLLDVFDDYLDCLGLAEDLIDSAPWRGEIQIASFHPHYCFADTEPEDQSNFTNRAPYPIFHLLREASLESAIESYGDTAEIPERNIAKLNGMSAAQLRDLFPWYVK